MIVFFELFITKIDPVNSYGFIYNNDFEKTLYNHPKMPWNNVFYGSSIVVGSFIEEKSESNYINLGLTYGKITDLRDMLSKEIISVKKNIVIGINFFTFMDNLKSDPTYIWYKKKYEPYLYFYRGPILEYLKDTVDKIKKGEKINQVSKDAYKKYITFGSLSEERLQEKINEYKKLYGNLTVDDFSNNINALEQVIKYCRQNDIRLRVIWMPWNPKDKPLEYVEDLKEKVNSILIKNEIEFIDWSNKYNTEFFYDLGHLNFDKGAPKFTEEIDKWLKK